MQIDIEDKKYRNIRTQRETLTETCHMNPDKQTAK